MYDELKNSFKKIRYLKKEIEILEKKKIKQETVRDSVKGSSLEPPYCIHTIKIEGVNVKEVIKSKKRLGRKLKALQDELAGLEKQLEAVDDFETKEILRMIYIFGLTQEETAKELGYSRSMVAMRIKRFFEKNLKN